MKETLDEILGLELSFSEEELEILASSGECLIVGDCVECKA